MAHLEDDDRVGIRTLFAIALVIFGLGVVALWGPWSDLEDSSGYGISPTHAETAAHG